MSAGSPAAAARETACLLLSAADALLAAELAPRYGLAVHLFHVDHGLDSGSSGRAEAAAALAQRVGLPFTCERHAVPAAAQRQEGSGRKRLAP